MQLLRMVMKSRRNFLWFGTLFISVPFLIGSFIWLSDVREIGFWLVYGAASVAAGYVWSVLMWKILSAQHHARMTRHHDRT